MNAIMVDGEKARSRGHPLRVFGLAFALAFLLSGTFRSVLEVAATLMVVQYLLMFVSVIVLRRREPELARPYRAWGYPWTTAAGLLIALAFLGGVAMADPLHSWIALGILVVSYPLYRGVSMLHRNSGV